MDIIHALTLQFNSTMDSIAEYTPTCGFTECTKAIKGLLTYGCTRIEYHNKNWPPVDIVLQDGDTVVVYLDGATAFADTFTNKSFALQHDIQVFTVDFLFFEEAFYTYTRFEQEIYGHRNEAAIYLELKELLTHKDALEEYKEFSKKHKDKVSANKSMEKGANAIYSRYSQCFPCIYVNKDDYTKLADSYGEHHAFFKCMCHTGEISGYCNSSHVNTPPEFSKTKTHGCCLRKDSSFNPLIDLYKHSVLSKPLRNVFTDDRTVTLEDICKSVLQQPKSTSPYVDIFAREGVTNEIMQDAMIQAIDKQVPADKTGDDRIKAIRDALEKHYRR